MDMYELRERYKAMPTAARCAILSVAVVLLPIYMLVEDSGKLEAQLAEKQQAETESRAKFESAKTKKRALPNEEQQVTFYQDSLRQARKMLPDDFQVDEILHSTATKAKEASVAMNLFDPADTITSNAEQGIRMQVVSLSLGGTYHQIAQFLDLMLHLDKLIHFEQFSISGSGGAGGNTNNNSGGTVTVSTAMTVYASN